MSTLSEVKARLLEQGTPFSYIKGATALAQVKDKPHGVLPVAFVFFAREVSAENARMTGAVLQRTERDLMVVFVCEDLGDDDGDAVQDELERLKAYVRRKLLGFLPADMQQPGEPLTHIAGEVSEAVHGCVWFEDTYSAPIFLKETT